MNWKSFGFGLLTAVITATLQYAQVLPAPWGAVASAVLVIVANFLPAASPKMAAMFDKK